ncbi:MAG: GDP-mannose dehydrogenase, partial [Gammaproteobacteria bacterium]
VGIDVSAGKVDALNAGHPPVLEPGLAEMLAQVMADGRLRATCDIQDGLADADLSMICVGTPSRSNGSLDLQYVLQVARQIGENLSLTATPHTVVVRSTVLPGSTRRHILPAIESAAGEPPGTRYDICCNPEFLREGSSVEDYDNPVRILVGEREPGGGSRVMELYAGIDAQRYSVPLEVAEATKYTDNAFHAVKVAFANEMARVWSAVGADPRQVMAMVAADTKLNVSPVYLRPGFAFGGSCLPKDVRAIGYMARENDVELALVDSLLPSNEQHIQRAYNRIAESGSRKVSMLGLAFKGGTDDLRESPLLRLAKLLIGEGYDLKIHDSAIVLSAIHGSNREFLEQQIPHVARVLSDDLDAVVTHGELLIVGHDLPQYDKDEQWRSAGKVVLRLA